MRKYLLFFTAFTFSTITFAQEFKLDAQIRPRFESRNGFGKLRPENDDLDVASNFVSQRSRLSLGYKSADGNLKFGAALQDVRTWGDLPQTTTKDKSSFMMHEAWGAIMFDPKWELKLGRQEIALDNARIMGNLDWAQQARAHDAAVLSYAGDFQLKLAYALSADGETLTDIPYDVANYKSLQFLWLNKKFSTVNLSFLFLNNGMEYVKDATKEGIAGRAIAYSQTTGSRLEFRKNKVGFNLEGYYQSGKDFSNRSLGAFDLITELIVKPHPNLNVTLGNEFLSGTDQDETDGKNHSFNPFYGTNHKFNGYIDYFYAGGRYLNNAGLNDIYLSGLYTKQKFSLELGLHAFNAMGRVFNAAAEEMDKYLGFEGDLVAGYKVNDAVMVQGGVSLLKGTDTLQRLVGGDKSKLSSWGWLSFNIKPTLLFIKK